MEFGYPREVAERIASGELLMDEASRAARIAEGETFSPVLYRGHASADPPLSDEDMFMTDSPWDAKTYALAHEDSYTDGSYGDGLGAVTPLRHNAGNLYRYDADSEDYTEVALSDEQLNELRLMGTDWEFEDPYGTDNIAAMIKADGRYQGTLFEDIKDEMFVVSSTDPSNVYNILGTRPEVKIRHQDAAYDPEYNGPNIMGATAAGAIGLGALTQSEDADASVAALAQRGLKVVRHGDHGNHFDQAQYDLIDEATDDYAGQMTVEALPNGNLWSLDTELMPQYRGQGIGNEYYDAVEELSGKTMQPSPWLSMDGVRFWGRRDPEALANMVRNDEFYDADNLGKVEGWLKDNEYAEFSHPEDNVVRLRGFGEKYGAPIAGALGLGALTQSEDSEAIALGTGAKNAPLDMLGMAKTMRHRGVPETEVHQKTGWWQGTDGNWRWELPDQGYFEPVPEVIKQGSVPGGKWENRWTTKGRQLGYDYDGNRIGWTFSPKNVQNLTGGDVLLENYPALAAIDIPTTRVPDPATMTTGNGGSMFGVGQPGIYPDEGAGLNSFVPAVYPNWAEGIHRWQEPFGASDGYFANPPRMKINQIYAPVKSPLDGGANETLAAAIDQYASTASHELQHAIQDLEGWAQGSGSDEGKRLAKAAAYNESRLLYDSGESTFESDPLIDEFERLAKKWTDLDTTIGGDFDNAPANLVEKYQQLDGDLEYLNLMYPHVREASIAREQAMSGTREGPEGLSDRQAYLNAAGEVESRNTQGRRWMPANLRRENPPWTTADTPLKDQTTIGNSQNPDFMYRTQWQPMRERLVKEGILMPDYERDALDLQREGLTQSEAWHLIMPQYRLDRETLEKNLDNYMLFKTGTPEQRQEMMLEAERIRAADGNRSGPFMDQHRGAATVPGMAAAAAGGGVLATAAANLASLYPQGTVDAVSELGALDSGIGAADTAVRAGQSLVNDIITGGTMVTNAVADEDYEPYEVDIDPGTAQGDTLAGGMMEDLGRLFEYKGIMGNMPSAVDMISGGIDLYNEYVSPYLPDRLEQGLGGAAILAGSLPFVPGRSTIRGAQRKYKPGIYQEPGALLEQAGAQVADESRALPDLFDVTRQDLYDIGSTRQGNLTDWLPPAAVANPRGSLHAEKVMKPANTNRLVNLLDAARGTDLEKGMVGWYVMDPVYQSYRSMGLSHEEAVQRYSQFQNFTGIMSANADVVTELNRGTGALYMNEQGRMDEWWKHGGNVELTGGPEDMSRIYGHPGHTTSHGKPLHRLLEAGALEMGSPKVPAYIAAAGIPETGFQTNFSVGDAHYVRGIALADARPSRPTTGDKTIGESWSMSEAQTLAPWWRDSVASQAGYEAVPAQATIWGALGPQTGVDTTIGKPKLEILADMIAFRAQERGISLEQAREEILMSMDYLSVPPKDWEY